MALIGWHSAFAPESRPHGDKKYRLRLPYEMILYEAPIEISIQTAAVSLQRLPLFKARTYELCVAAGWEWDGPSGPVPDHAVTMRASLAHDGLYFLMRQGLLSRKHRAWTDEIFRQILIEDKVPPWFARACYWGLRVGAGYAAKGE
jgi:hypothetical protein